MNVLVTGAGGFIGGSLAKRLVGECAVYGLVHERIPAKPTFEPVLGDVTDYDRMLEILVNYEIDQIYHYAARPIVRNCCLDPIGCFRTNVLGTAIVLEAARQTGRLTGILCMESDKSYGPISPPYDEAQAPQPAGVYEASKACIGHVVQAYYRNYGLPVFSIRSANVYGPGDENLTRLIPRTIIRLLQGLPPQIVEGAANFVREFVFIDDMVNCTISLMGKTPWGMAINVGSGSVHTVGEVIDMISRLMDKSLPAETWGKPATLLEIESQSLRTNRLENLLPNGIEFRSLQEGLRETITWYRRTHKCREAGRWLS